jgi:hypothetical protein
MFFVDQKEQGEEKWPKKRKAAVSCRVPHGFFYTITYSEG